MKILVTGACGNMGPHIIRKLVQSGHEIRAFDKDNEGLVQFSDIGLETCCGNIADKSFVQQAVNGVDAIIHLAWSFSDNLPDLLDIDVKGYQYILDAAVKSGIRHVINTTTAVSYGKPLANPVTEDQPHLAEQSRNPVYALAKLITEELGKIYSLDHNLYVNNVMVWYAYGDVIGGRNIRVMIRDAIEKGCIEVPANSGGSFLQLDDFVTGVLDIFSSKVKGELFNLASIYLTWEDVARQIIALVNPEAKVIVIPPNEWKGSAFLTDDWPLSIEKAEKMLHFKTNFSKDQAIANLSNALKVSVDKVKAQI